MIFLIVFSAFSAPQPKPASKAMIPATAVTAVAETPSVIFTIVFSK